MHLDVVRVVSALAIVALHWRGSLSLSQNATAALTARLEFLNLGVDLFFVISGIVIHHVYGARLRSWSDFGLFMQRRLARLGPLHWATLLFFIAVGAAASHLGLSVKNDARYDPACILPSVLLAHSTGLCATATYNFASWSISAEMIVYLLAPALLMLLRRARWSTIALAACMLAVLYAVGSHGPGAGTWVDWTYEGGFWRAIPAFALGLGLSANRALLARLPHPGAALLAAAAALVVLGWCEIPTPWLAPLAYAVAALALARDARGVAGPMVRAVAPAGQLTYSIYMLHLPLQTVLLSTVGESVLRLSGARMNLLVALGVPVLFLVSYLSLSLFETPLRKRISSLGRGRRAAEPAPLANLLAP